MHNRLLIVQPRRAKQMKLTIDSFRLNATTGLAPSVFAGCARMEAARLLNSSGLLSNTACSVGAEKPHNPDDGNITEAIRLAQQGDAAAFEFIYRRHCGRVYSLCLRMVKDPSQAEDLTQDAFMQVFRKIHTFRGESAFSSWLHRLTVNIVLMRLRKKKLILTSLDQVFVADDGEGRPGDEAGGPDVRLTGIFDRANLQRAVDQLPQGYKAMFILHDVEGYQHKEIAKILGCSVGTCKSQLHRARKGIREFLERLQHHRRQADRGTAKPSLVTGLSY
jgi:RNA polymerase sigma-70 factor, ECF subfamily